jgi:tRNA(His) 5'-end guanylyltransferase
MKHRAYDAFYLFIVISILSGSYTTVVFTLLALFSKTALGRGYDEQFLQFWSATTGIRESGLEAFLASLVCFELAFILSLYLRTEGRRRKILVLLACCIAAYSFSRWAKIMQLVSTFLFPIRAEMEY